jgi:starch-binding outer membrane protein, SusD/RagB family
VWNTFYEDYYTDSGDPRTPWGETPTFRWVTPGWRCWTTSVRLWYFQLKHDQRESPHELSSGWEMRLLEAENRLCGLISTTR